MARAHSTDRILLGRTGLAVSRVGIGASYGISALGCREAFDMGVNYFYWGSLRRKGMAEAIRELAPRYRDQMVVVLQSYSRVAAVIPWSVKRALRQLGLECADILLLGWFNRPPREGIVEKCMELKDRGIVRYLGVSCHHRPTFQRYIADGVFDVLMARYNAAHRGAEREVFPYLPAEGGPGIVCYTATRWGSLLSPRRVPAGEKVPRAIDCYRFVLSHPGVHVCLTGPANEHEMREALEALERGPLGEEELAWMRRVGDHVHRNRG